MVCLIHNTIKSKNESPSIEHKSHTQNGQVLTYLSPSLCHTGVQIIRVEHQQSFTGVVQLTTNVQVGTNHCWWWWLADLRQVFQQSFLGELCYQMCCWWPVRQQAMPHGFPQNTTGWCVTANNAIQVNLTMCSLKTQSWFIFHPFFQHCPHSKH